VRYEIIFSPEAEADIAALKAIDRAKALEVFKNNEGTLWVELKN